MTRLKECSKCKTVKPMEMFYKHSRMLDGHLNSCIECVKKRVHQYRIENIEKIRQYDRERANQAHRRKKNLEINQAWRNEDRRRVSCHNKVVRAIKKGILERLPCEWCGEQKSVAHHEDYDKPLDVMWLCQPCHKKRHKQINERLQNEQGRPEGEV